MKKIIVIVAAALLAASLLYQQAIYSDPLRLHVIANSDSARDQSIKLIVRDAVLDEAAEKLGCALSLGQARALAFESTAELELAANNALAAEGARYKASVETGIFAFPEKSYGSIVYPAGDYPAVRVVLGEGEGKNWWCVVYPQMCLVNTKKTNAQVKLKSALIEWIRSLR